MNRLNYLGAIIFHMNLKLFLNSIIFGVIKARFRDKGAHT